MIDGEIESAMTVTPETIYETNKEGITVAKQVWVSLDAPKEKLIAIEKSPKIPAFEYDDVNMLSPPPERTQTYRVRMSLQTVISALDTRPQTQKDYIQQYVDRMDDILEALLTKEALPEGTGECRHCKNSLAVWRCKDCLLPTPMCHRCMRLFHMENPLHRIEQWNGRFFHPAELWEVGTYLLIRHHTGEAICDTLLRWCNLLESAEETKDNIEQEKLQQSRPVHESAPGPVPVSDPDQYLDRSEIYIDTEGQAINEVDDDDNDEYGGDDEDLDEGIDLEEVNPYLSSAGTGGDPALASATLGSYLRVVHLNGLHHIAMVSCQCHGEDVLPLDLFAAKLLPASFKRIRTLFMAQVLDMFRLCNLELKASAYQFYQLLRRLTRPMAPAEVTNLYREFRRMSRLWRHMKKLKWAGYAGRNKPVKDVKPGELAVFCPACPQPGINIPDNWKDDPARYVVGLVNFLSF
jgi:KDZ transposase family protein